ncbi:MAG: type II toxin-antitoxin system PemK/MazF family toxin [Actinomycetota bacterium]|nr:type II toxin-antitoxin system PemK/MazF family toxin [Actinomycetota bacterium]
MAPDVAGSLGLESGAVAWASLVPVRGREQGGHRPVVIVASRGYLDTVTTLALVVPITTTDRGWPNHIRLTGDVGLDVPCWAMTEQLRTISRTRLTRVSGQLSEGCLRDIRTWLADFLDLFTG